MELFMDDESEDELDEFLFDSIQRYSTLKMFSVENVPEHLLQLNDNSLCVVSKRIKVGNSELMKMRLPDKLTLSPERQGRSKGNDFKVLSGLYTDFALYQIRKLGSDCKVIVSGIGSSGLRIYDLNTGLTSGDGVKLYFPKWEAFELVVSPETNHVLCSRMNSEPLLQYDVYTEKVIKEIIHPFKEIQEKNFTTLSLSCKNTIKCEFFDSNTIGILNTHTANMVFHDLRTSNNFSFCTKPNDCKDKIWTLSNQDCQVFPQNYYALLSNTKSICIGDRRTNTFFKQKTGSCFTTNNNKFMRISFNNKSEKLLVSGLDSSVDVFKVNDKDCSLVFSHVGHSPKNLASHIVTDHIWLQAGEKEFVVSVCDNKTLHCWDYNV